MLTPENLKHLHKLFPHFGTEKCAAMVTQKKQKKTFFLSYCVTRVTPENLKHLYKLFAPIVVLKNVLTHVQTCTNLKKAPPPGGA